MQERPLAAPALTLEMKGLHDDVHQRREPRRDGCHSGVFWGALLVRVVHAVRASDDDIGGPALGGELEQDAEEGGYGGLSFSVVVGVWAGE